MHSVSFVFDGNLFTIMFSGYSLAWQVPQVFRDARQRTISAKRPPSKTPEAPRQQPIAGRMRIRRGKDRGESAELSEVQSGLAGYETSCSLHDRGGFTLHSAQAIGVWRRRGF